MTSSQVKRLSLDAMLLCVAMMLSYLESILPLSLLLPLPGAKLGLANIALTLCFFSVSPVDAAIVSLTRITLTSLLFGNLSSFLFSLFGAMLAYLGMFFAKTLRKHFTFYGISVLSAALHNLGQCIAAVILLDNIRIFGYLPLLLIFSVIFGLITGSIITPCSKLRVFNNA